MKERGILFSAPMVRAILEGRKWQTRRIIKPHPWFDGNYKPGDTMWTHSSLGGFFAEHVFGACMATLVRCPRGIIGDRLWVRETWAWPGEEYVLYQATDQHLQDKARSDPLYPQFNWRPSIFMPRWASRITLEITEVRVQRLQDISEEDANAEGAQIQPNDPFEWDHRRQFQALWQKINGPESWDLNPWVWAISFRRVP